MENNNTFKSCFIGTLFSAVMLIAMTLILAAVAKMTPIGENIIGIGCFIIMFIAGISGGIVAGKGMQKMGIICGTTVAVTLIILIKLIELVSTSKITFDDGFYISSLCTFVGSVLGGIIGVN